MTAEEAAGLWWTEWEWNGQEWNDVECWNVENAWSIPRSSIGSLLRPETGGSAPRRAAPRWLGEAVTFCAAMADDESASLVARRGDGPAVGTCAGGDENGSPEARQLGAREPPEAATARSQEDTGGWGSQEPRSPSGCNSKEPGVQPTQQLQIAPESPAITVVSELGSSTVIPSCSASPTSPPAPTTPRPRAPTKVAESGPQPPQLIVSCPRAPSSASSTRSVQRRRWPERLRAEAEGEICTAAAAARCQANAVRGAYSRSPSPFSWSTVVPDIDSETTLSE